MCERCLHIVSCLSVTFSPFLVSWRGEAKMFLLVRFKTCLSSYSLTNFVARFSKLAASATLAPLDPETFLPLCSTLSVKLQAFCLEEPLSEDVTCPRRHWNTVACLIPRSLLLNHAQWNISFLENRLSLRQWKEASFYRATLQQTTLAWGTRQPDTTWQLFFFYLNIMADLNSFPWAEKSFFFWVHRHFVQTLFNNAAKTCWCKNMRDEA